MRRAWLWAPALVLLVLLAGGASALRVLGVVPFASKSHHAVLQAPLRALAERGHLVTSLEFFPPPSPAPATYTSVLLNDTFFSPLRGSFNMFDLSDTWYPARVIFLWGMGNMMVDAVLQQPQVQAVARRGRGAFDLVVVESFFNEAFLGLAHVFDAPIVQVCPYVGSAWMYSAVASPSPAAYIPDPFLPFSDHMTFPQRLTNLLFGIYQELGRELYYLPAQDAAMRRWLSVDASRPLPHVRQLQSSTALLLLNSHEALSYPRPLAPAAVLVGGMHVRPARALPQDLEKIISRASHGVIFFSMGSALQSSQLPKKTVSALLKVFASLKQLVLWKWEADTLPEKPANVEIRKWFPQNDILAHRNIKLFITHGGLLSSFEAMYHGVPLVGIPVFGDQQLNMERAEMAGYGNKILYKDLSATTLQNALNEVLSNKRYKETAKKLSQILRDQPETPLERAVWWIEYIARHKGASHLQSAAKDLTWYQYHMLDVLLVVLGISLFVASISVWFVMFLCHVLLSKQSKQSSQIQNRAKKRN